MVLTPADSKVTLTTQHNITTTMKQNLKNLKSLMLSASIFAATGLTCILVTSCEDKPKSLGEKIGDGLDSRPNEKLKDAGEDIKDAVKDATN